jgi:hypothetical protein
MSNTLIDRIRWFPLSCFDKVGNSFLFTISYRSSLYTCYNQISSFLSHKQYISCKKHPPLLFNTLRNTKHTQITFLYANQKQSNIFYFMQFLYSAKSLLLLIQSFNSNNACFIKANSLSKLTPSS